MRSWRNAKPAEPDRYAFTVYGAGRESRAGIESGGHTSKRSTGTTTPWRGQEEGAVVLEPDLTAPLLAGEKLTLELHRQLNFAYSVSWVVNILLFVSKGYAWWLSGSKAVLASLVDSFVDLVSQIVIFVAEWRSRLADPRFPVGQARLETIGVLACAIIMAVASFEVVNESVQTLVAGFVKGKLPDIDTSIVMYSVLGVATVLKLGCYIICIALAAKSDSMVALAEDHLNDIMSNVGAAVTALVAGGAGSWKFFPYERTWWVDAAGAILISLLILWRWLAIAKTQVFKIVGRAAPEELVMALTTFANAHHEQLEVDCIRAYHFGAKFIVEMEVVMPIASTLQEVHDISLELQNRLEALEPVERAFVHVDYQRRDLPEHRTERLLAGLPVLHEEPLPTTHSLDLTPP